MNIEDVLLSHDIKPTLNRCEIMRILLECDFPLSIKDFESLINEHLLPYLNEKNEAILKNDNFTKNFHKKLNQDFKHF